MAALACATVALSCSGTPRVMNHGKQGPGPRAASPGQERERDLGGPVVAVAADGSCIVQRGTHVDVLGPDSAHAKALPIGDTAGKPGVWYALSAGARFAARADRAGWIELWDVTAAKQVARLDPGAHVPRGLEMPLAGPAYETAASWGAPTFLEDGLLVTHHHQAIVLWDVATRRPRCVLKDPALFLARQTFSLAAGRAAVRSGSDTPGITNATLVEFSTHDCAVVERHLVPARDLVVAAAGGGVRFVFTINGVRAMERTGVVDTVLSEGTLQPQAIEPSPDGRTLAWAAGGAVGVWFRESNRVARLARPNAQAPVLHVRMADGWLRAIEGSGKVRSWRVPEASAGEPVKSRAVTPDQMARERAIVQLGLRQPRAALAELDLITAPDAKAAVQFLAAYVQSIATGEHGDAFRARVQRQGIKYANEPATFAVARDLTSAEVLGPALDVYLYWLEGAKPGSRPEEAVNLGLELVLQLSESDDHELKKRLLQRLHEVFPTNKRVEEGLAE